MNRLQVIIRKQQMTCKGVPERVRRNPFGDAGPRGGLFDGTLNMGLVKVIAALFPELWNEGEGGCREEPLPDELFGGVLVFLLLGDPESVGLQGPEGVVAEEDRRLEVAVFLLPGSAGAPCRRPC